MNGPLDEEERVCNLIADSIAPRLVPNLELISQGDRTVLAVEVFHASAIQSSRAYFENWE